MDIKLINEIIYFLEKMNIKGENPNLKDWNSLDVEEMISLVYSWSCIN